MNSDPNADNDFRKPFKLGYIVKNICLCYVKESFFSKLLHSVSLCLKNYALYAEKFYLKIDKVPHTSI